MIKNKTIGLPLNMNRLTISLVSFIFILSSVFSLPLSAFAATKNWDFSSSNDYIFDDEKIEFLSGQAQLKPTSGWYNNDWLNRKEITVNNTANASTLNDFQVKVDVTYVANMQTDFDDIIFTDSDKITLLPYWRESKVDSTSATFWVKVPSITGSSNKTIYMYYGNSGTTTASNGENTFVNFDDFTNSTTHVFAYGSDSGFMSAFDPVERNFYFFGAAADNLSDYNVSNWVNIDTWNVGYAYPSMTVSNGSAIFHPVLEKFYIYGGTDGGVVHNRIYSYDPRAQTFTQLSETLPQNLNNPEVVYDPESEKIYIFGGRKTFSGGSSTFTDKIYVHNLDLETPTVTDTTAVLPRALEGMMPIYSSEDQKIYLFGGAFSTGSALNSTSSILVYDPETPSVNPTYTGSNLPTGRDTMGTAYVNGNVYIFGGYNWTTSSYFDTVYKYDISSNTLTTLAETMYKADDDMKAFYDSVNDKIYIGPVLHSTSDQNEEERKNVILEFDPNTETFADEPSLGTTPNNWTTTGTASIDIPRAIGGTYLSFSDHSDSQYVAATTSITTLSDVKMVEFKVDIANSSTNHQFYVSSRPFNFFTNSATVLRNFMTTNWLLGTATSTNQTILTIPKGKHIIGALLDVPNKKHYGLVNRANKTSAFNWIADSSSINTIEINTPASGTTGILVDWILVRNSTTGVDPTVSIGSETTLYSDDQPTIKSFTVLPFSTLSSFSESSTLNGGTIKYQLSNDAGSTWYWYNNGWTTTNSGYAESSTASVVNSNIATFPQGSGRLLIKAYLNSNGTQLVQLDNVSVSYTDPISVSSSGSYVGIPGYTRNQLQPTNPTNQPNTTSTIPSSYTFSSNLSLGMTSLDVMYLQKYLNANGFIVSSQGPGSLGNESNYFGQKTQTALIAYQKAKGIYPQLGYFGPLTRNTINTNSTNITNTTVNTQPFLHSSQAQSFEGQAITNNQQPVTTFIRALYLGLRGNDVKTLQDILIREGLLEPGLNTGFYGPLTKQALGQLQIKNRLVISPEDPGFGYVGPNTRSVLDTMIKDLGVR